jgi:glycosyltransferase involved in cell wall biosynthesis
MRGAVAIHVCRGREWRGGERQVRLLVETLAWRSGFLQHVVTGRASALAAALDPSGPPIHRVPWPLGYDPRAWLDLHHLIHRLTPTHGRDIVLHAHDSHALGLALLAGRWHGLPVIATRRSVTPPGRLWRQPARVIAISAAVEATLRAAGVAEARIVRIPSAISLTHLAHAAAVPSQPLLDVARPIILAAGALTAEKGHRTLIEALPELNRLLPAPHLALIGEGPERGRLQRLARRGKVADRVHFLGERPSIAGYLHQVQVFAQPSHREALGTAVLEAMALGIPVVASETGGLVELLTGGAGLLVPPGNPLALAEALGRVLTDALLRGAIVHEARARASEYDAPQLADRVAEVYRSALRTP